MNAPTATRVPFGAPIPTLTRWGLSSDADLVFRTLATFGPRPAARLAAELGLSRPRTDAGLAELRACGAAVAVAEDGSAGRRIPVWVSRPPDTVVRELRLRRLRYADREAQAARHRGIVRSMSDRLAGVGLPIAPALAGVIGDGVRYLQNRELLRQRLAELVPAERHEHLAINTEEVFDAQALRGAPLSSVLIENGVTARGLGRPPADQDSLMSHLASPSYVVRETHDVPMKLFVCDRRVALFPVDPLDFDRGYLEVRHPAVVTALVGLFEKHWAEAADPRAGGTASIVLSDRERGLVDLLALGHTDATAAVQLRISPRSVTNLLRGLMDRLAVDNRFQLGLALGALRVAEPPALTTSRETR